MGEARGEKEEHLDPSRDQPSLLAAAVSWRCHDKLHGLGGLSSRNSISHHSGGQKSEIKVWGGGGGAPSEGCDDLHLS